VPQSSRFTLDELTEFKIHRFQITHIKRELYQDRLANFQ
jgi:hypothetical protein